MINYIAKWHTYHFEQSDYGYAKRYRTRMAHMVYAEDSKQAEDMVKQMDPQAHMIDIAPYKESE
jgi:hypothetical protein